MNLKEKMGSISEREQFLVIGLLMVVLIGVYMVFRHQQNSTTLAVQQERFEEVQADNNSLRLVKSISGSKQQEARQLESLKKEFEQISSQLKQTSENLVDNTNERAVERRWADVSLLFRRNGLLIKSRKDFEDKIGGLEPFVRGSSSVDIINRPMQTVKATGSYRSFHDLLDDIQTLGWMLAVLKMNLSVEEVGNEPLISAELILVI
jgi:uncharacterized membrane-anchored protein YhcB (DUF1043 family)